MSAKQVLKAAENDKLQGFKLHDATLLLDGSNRGKPGLLKYKTVFQKA